MRFNKGRTSVRGSLEGLEEYERTIQAGTLREITVYPCVEREVRGVCKKLRLEEFPWREKSSQGPLEVLAMRIRPRCPPVDELTRHPNTDQVFIPVTGALLAVAGSSSTGDQNNPDPASNCCYSRGSGRSHQYQGRSMAYITVCHTPRPGLLKRNAKTWTPITIFAI